MQGRDDEMFSFWWFEIRASGTREILNLLHLISSETLIAIYRAFTVGCSDARFVYVSHI